MNQKFFARRSNQIAAGVVLGVMFALVGLLVVTGFSFERSQQLKYREFRDQLADGTAPIDSPLVKGAPVAIVKAPSIGLDAVVLEGTDTRTLQAGVGHLRSSTLPGQRGTSVLAGRKTLFGGVFGKIVELKVGDTISVISAQGESTFTVRSIDTFAASDAAAFAPSGDALRLVTSTSSWTGGRRVSVLATADSSSIFPTGARGVAEPISADELGLNFDHTAAGSLLAWLQVLLIAFLGGTFLVHRWGIRRAWIFVSPTILVIAIFVVVQFASVLPGLA